MAKETKKQRPERKKDLTPETQEQAKRLSESITQVIVALLTLCKELSLFGIIVISVISMVFLWASEEQKRGIIDSYILLRSPHGHVICCTIISGLTAVMTFGYIFHKKLLKLEREEVRRLSDWKTGQQNVFERPLNSSKQKI